MEIPFTAMDFIRFAGVPALAAGALYFVAHRGWNLAAPLAGRSHANWSAPVSIALGIAIAFFPAQGRAPKFPPAEAIEWLLLAVLVAAFAGVADARWRMPAIARASLAFLLSATCALFVLRFMFRSDWTGPRAAGAFIAIGAIGAAWWAALDASERDPHSRSAIAWITWILASCTGVMLMMSGSLKYGQLGLSLAGVAGAAIVLTLALRRRILARGVAMALAVVFVLLLLAGYYTADAFPPRYAAAMLVAPVFVIIGRLIPLKTDRRWLITLVRVAPVVLYMLAVMTPRTIEEIRKMNDAEADPYGSAYSLTPSSDLPARHDLKTGLRIPGRGEWETRSAQLWSAQRSVHQSIPVSRGGE